MDAPLAPAPSAVTIDGLDNEVEYTCTLQAKATDTSRPFLPRAELGEVSAPSEPFTPSGDLAAVPAAGFTPGEDGAVGRVRNGGES